MKRNGARADSPASRWFRRLSALRMRRAEALVVNVKSSADPVFVMPMARHYGRIYDIPQKSDAWKAHSIDILISVMRKVYDLAR